MTILEIVIYYYSRCYHFLFFTLFSSFYFRYSVDIDDDAVTIIALASLSCSVLLSYFVLLRPLNANSIAAYVGINSIAD